MSLGDLSGSNWPTNQHPSTFLSLHPPLLWEYNTQELLWSVQAVGSCLLAQGYTFSIDTYPNMLHLTGP